MPQIDINGVLLNYLDEGARDAPALLMSNSLGTNLHMWDDIATDLAGQFRLIRYDSRGHGRSGAPDGPYSIELLADDALALMDALNIERFNFCGLSKGGMVGQWLGTHAGARLIKLVLANTSPHMPPRELWDNRIELATTSGMPALEKMILERWMTPAFRAASPDAVERVRKMILTTPPQGYAACCMAIREMDQRETISAVRTPSLVIVGTDDPATPPAHGQLIAEKIPGAQLATIQAAHLSVIEQPGPFLKTVLDFLR